MNKCELLAPVRDWECLETAINFGADAVYLGGKLLQLRAAGSGFDAQTLQKAVEYAHARGKKAYVAVNAFARNDEIASAGDYARYLRDLGADAAIISDLGVLTAFADAAPDLERHISTQANCVNYMTAAAYYNMGAKRIVLARELSLEDIGEIRAKAPKPLELEAFVHGAMCMAYSGRCLISSYLTGRSANRGECTQPCRWNFSLSEEKRPGEYFDVQEDENGTAILSSHDLCCVEFLDEIEAAGVTAFKIEGRMKTEYYVATAVNAYRRAMDGADTAQNCRQELECITHRPYSSGFYYSELIRAHANDGRYMSRCTFVANVLEYQKDRVKLRQRNHFKVGDTLEVLSPHRPVFSFVVQSMENEKGERQDTAPHPNQTLFVPCPEGLMPGDFLRRRE